MKIFKNYTFSWRQMVLFKIALLSIGIAIGACWPEIFSPYAMILIVLGIVLGLYLAFVSFR